MLCPTPASSGAVQNFGLGTANQGAGTTVTAGQINSVDILLDTAGSTYEVTPHVEDVLTFLDRALERDLGFVGTESRLRVVIDMLADLVAGATDDPEVRLKHLRETRASIDEEIERVLLAIRCRGSS